LRRWGEGLTHDDREEMRAAGRAILLLTEEIELLHIDIWHAQDQEGLPQAEEPEEIEGAIPSGSADGDVPTTLRERLSVFRFSHR
jgi:hypothetical protein